MLKVDVSLIPKTQRIPYLIINVYHNTIENVQKNLNIITDSKIETRLLGCSASRGMRQTFAGLSKLGGTTNLMRLLFGHVK